MKHFISLIVLSIAAILQVQAQDIAISVSAPRVVEEGGIFNVRYSINTDPGNMFSVETCKEIEASGRPQTGTSSSISIINGKMSQSQTYTETRQFRATQKGTFPVPIASVKIDGKTYRSKSMTIEVVDRTTASSQQNQQQSYQNYQQSQNTQEPKATSASGEMFARIFVNKTTAYIGEPILATIKLYTQKDITGINDNSYPDFNGFYKRVL